MGPFMNSVREELLRSLTSRGACTAIRALIAHRLASTSPTLDVLVTDGDETCAPLNPLPASRSQVILVLVPTRGDLRATVPALMVRAEEWRQLVPGLRVVLPNDITDAYWVDLAGKIDFAAAPIDSK